METYNYKITRNRWDDNVKQDICKIKIKNWTVCVQDRGKWRDVVEKAMKLLRLEKEKKKH
jgi:hypothetical protein